jgi:TRAP-type C4-dicarboxylate transport system permease small subunit
MQGLNKAILRVATAMDILGGVVLTLMMLITVMDVILRFFGRPITGTYELVFLGGAVVVGTAIPMTSWEGGHVNVDLLLESLTGVTRKATLVFTRVCGIVFFFFLGWNLFAHGVDLYERHEVSLTLHVPYYPVAYILGVCAFVECLVLLSDLINAIQGVSHE